MGTPSLDKMFYFLGFTEKLRTLCRKWEQIVGEVIIDKENITFKEAMEICRSWQVLPLIISGCIEINCLLDMG